MIRGACRRAGEGASMLALTCRARWTFHVDEMERMSGALMSSMLDNYQSVEGGGSFCGEMDVRRYAWTCAITLSYVFAIYAE